MRLKLVLNPNKRLHWRLFRRFTGIKGKTRQSAPFFSLRLRLFSDDWV